MRDELVEMLAHELYEMRYFETWDRGVARGDANRQGWCRADAATMLPGVVAFVAEWLEHWNHVIVEDGPVIRGSLAEMWREEMGR